MLRQNILLLCALSLPNAIFSQTGAHQPVTGTARTPRIVDITASTGIHFQHLSSPEAKYIVESMSGGVALIDYDMDGWPDIYFTNAPSVAMALNGEKAKSALYHNNGDGSFTDVTDKAGVGFPCWAMGAAVGDYNGDGRPDLVVSCFGGVVLYRNNGDGTFTDATKASGLDKDKGWATGVSFGDYDGDGHVDLIVPHYVDLDLHALPTFGSLQTCQYHGVAVQCGPRGLKGSPDSLYHNNGDGTFTDVAAQAGVDDPQHFFGLGTLWTDIDGDGKLDLFLANDGERNFLYKNQGNGTFKDVALNAGVAVSDEGAEQANMGIAEGDYLHTGRSSFFISHFSDEYATLYRNDSPLNYSDVSLATGIAHASSPYVGWGDAFLDLDNSGWLDIVLVNGHVYPQVDNAHNGVLFKEPMLVFQNQRDGRFQDITTQTGTAARVPEVSRGLAVGDLFHNGAIDLVVENLTGEPRIFALKPDLKNHWISLSLIATHGDPLALNARVTVTAEGFAQTGEVHSGGSYLSQNELALHFGLGLSTRVEKMDVRWPNGTMQSFTNVETNRRYILKEGSTLEPSK